MTYVLVPSDSSLILSHIRVAGYHDDLKAFCRLYVENRISKAVADKAYNAGRKQKRDGVPCGCYLCKKKGFKSGNN